MAKVNEEKVKIKIPKAPRGEDNFILVSINGAAPTKIMRGVKVEVTKAQAEVIQNSLDADDQLDLYIETATKNANK